MFCHNTEKWLYKLNEDYRWQSPFLQDSDWAFQDHTGKTRLKLMRDGTIVVIGSRRFCRTVTGHFRTTQAKHG